MKMIKILNYLQNFSLWAIFIGLIISTVTKILQGVLEVFVFSESRYISQIINFEYYPVVGVQVFFLFLLRKQWKWALYLAPLLVWALWGRIFRTRPRYNSNEIELWVYQTGSFFDKATLSYMLILIVVSILLWCSVHIFSNQPPANKPLDKKQVDNPGKSQPVQPSINPVHPLLPKIQSVILFIISPLLILSTLLLVIQTSLTYFQFNSPLTTFTDKLYSYGLLVIIPGILHLIIVTLIGYKWKPVSLVLPYLIISLFDRAFIATYISETQGLERFAAYSGLYLDRVLIGLILLNTMLLPIDWIKGFRAKKAAQAS